MDDSFSPRSSTTSVYTFNSHTGKLSFAVRRPSPRSGSYSASSEDHVYTLALPSPNSRTPSLGEGSPGIIEEIPIRGGQTVYFVTKLDPQSLPSQGFVAVSDSTARRAKQHIMDMERLVWQLEAALAEEDGSPESDYEADVEEFEDEFLEFSDYESDDRGLVDISEVTLAMDYLPESGVHEDSMYASGSCADDGPAGAEVSSSLSSDSSNDSVTFDPPSSSASPTEGLAPSTLSTSASSQTTPPSVSALPSTDYSEIEEPSMPSQPESSCGDGSVFLETPSGRHGPGCPPTEEEPFCPACYGAPIRLLWGDEPSVESLSDLVDELIGEEDDFLLDEAAALVATHPFVDVDLPIDPPIVAADWSLSQALTSLEPKTAAISGAGSSTSISSLFSERQVAHRSGSNSESEEPLDKALKRLRRTRGTGSDAPSQDAPQAPPEADESAGIPPSSLRVLRGEKEKQRRPKPRHQKPRHSKPPRQPATGRSAPTPASSNVSGRQEPPARPRKRARDDDDDEGEISEHESESDPDTPLAEVIASRGRSQSILGHGPPPPKRVRLTSVVEPRWLSRESSRSRRSWAHRRWEERLMQRHARASHEGRRCMRVTSTDEEQLRRGIHAASGPRSQ